MENNFQNGNKNVKKVRTLTVTKNLRIYAFCSQCLYVHIYHILRKYSGPALFCQVGVELNDLTRLAESEPDWVDLKRMHESVER